MKKAIKKYLPRSLLGRSLLILIVPVLLIQVITTYMFFARHWEKMADRLAFAVAGEIAIISARIEQDPSEQQFEQIAYHASRSLDLDVRFERGVTLEIIPVTYHGWGAIVSTTLDRALDAQVRRPFDIKLFMDEKKVQVDVQLKGGVLHVDMPQRRLFSSSAYIFLLWMVGTSIVLLAVAILFMRGQIRPIRRLAIAAEKFGKGRDVPFFKPEGAREVRQAARAFIDMRERLNRQIQQRTSMLAGVSHDLRTPLTRMKLQLSMMEGDTDSEGLKSDLSDMEKMIDAYLTFAKGDTAEEPERSDLTSMLRRVAESFEREGTHIDLAVEEGMSLLLRPVAFERCLNNLLGNAKKYGHGHIALQAKRDEDKVTIIIDDDGPGIPEEQYDEVFKPFARLDQSRNSKTGGVGLGLPIAQDIVHTHGGEIVLGQSPQEGLRVTIELPV